MEAVETRALIKESEDIEAPDTPVDKVAAAASSCMEAVANAGVRGGVVRVATPPPMS